MNLLSFFKLLIVFFNLSILIGCADFGFIDNSSNLPSLDPPVAPSPVGPSPLIVQTPTDGSTLVPGALFSVTGLCDSDGGDVTIVGSSFSEPSVSETCDALTGTFSINVTAVNVGSFLDVQATQTDLDGQSWSDVNIDLMIHCAGAAMQACAVSGSGNSSDPYSVGDIDCLQEMRDGLTCHYQLENDIDASATLGWNGGDGWTPVGGAIGTASSPFRGFLDGRNFTISDLYITPQTLGQQAGLFGVIGDSNSDSIVDVQVFNLTLENAIVEGLDFRRSWAILAAMAETVAFDNVNIVNSNIDATTNTRMDVAGGLFIGEANNVRVTNSSASGEITFDGGVDGVLLSYRNVGGFIGVLSRGSQVLDSTVNTTMLTSNTNLFNFGDIGGVFGRVDNSTVNRFRAATNLDITTLHTAFAASAIDSVGGFVGSTDQSIFDSICINSNIDVLDEDTSIGSIGGFAGYIAKAVGGDTFDKISISGSMNLNANDNGGTHVGSYYGKTFNQVSVHNDVVSNMDVTLENVVMPNFDFYGGMAGDNHSNTTLNNFFQYGAHEFIGTTVVFSPGGIIGDLNSSTVSNMFSAIDASLGGLPGVGSGPDGGTVSGFLGDFIGAPNSTYTGFDFTNTWRRHPVTNIPELQYCPATL